MMLGLFMTVAVLISGGTQAGVIYNVDRSWLDTTLVGTVEIAIGGYSITNPGVSPFDAINLTMTVQGTPYIFTDVLTDLVSGSGVFDIMATPTELIFSAAGNSANPAVLKFVGSGAEYYVVGADSIPAFEAAFVPSPIPIFQPNPGVAWPLVYGTAADVPVPGTIALFGLGLAGLGLLRRKQHS